MRAEVFVDVFECATGGFGEEEIYDWYEAEVEDGPDDVEAPAESADSDGGDFYDLWGGLGVSGFFFFFVFLGRVSPLWFENTRGRVFGPDSRSFLLIETYHKITWKKREMLVFEFYPKEKKKRKHSQIQFVAVPNAAPLFLILKPLISAGYNHGTPCIPMPKKT